MFECLYQNVPNKLLDTFSVSENGKNSHKTDKKIGSIFFNIKNIAKLHNQKEFDFNTLYLNGSVLLTQPDFLIFACNFKCFTSPWRLEPNLITERNIS